MFLFMANDISNFLQGFLRQKLSGQGLAFILAGGSGMNFLNYLHKFKRFLTRFSISRVWPCDDFAGKVLGGFSKLKIQIYMSFLVFLCSRLSVPGCAVVLVPPK